MQPASQQTNPPKHLDGIGAIADRYDHYILDIWGVIHNGIAPFTGTIACLQSLKAQNKSILLLSNTPDRSHTVADNLTAMGVTPDLYDHILTAGESAWLGLQNRADQFHQDCGTFCFCPGDDFRADENGIPLFFQDLDVTFVDDPADATFFLNACGGATDSLDHQWDQTKAALAHNLPMICTNPDLVVHVGDELYVCAGTFAKYYEENGGAVLYHGKPHTPIYEMAHSLLGRPDKSRMLAVGDSLHTDIQGANSFGIDSVFNFSGIHGEELANGDGLDDVLGGQPHRPQYALDEFKY